MRKPGSYIKDKGKIKPNSQDEAMTARANSKGAQSVDAKRKAQEVNK